VKCTEGRFQNKREVRYLDLKEIEKQINGENCFMADFTILTLHLMLLDEKIKKHEVGGTCSTQEECDHLGDIYIDRHIM
jgi:hypothetical protein